MTTSVKEEAEVKETGKAKKRKAALGDLVGGFMFVLKKISLFEDYIICSTVYLDILPAGNPANETNYLAGYHKRSDISGITLNSYYENQFSMTLKFVNFVFRIWIRFILVSRIQLAKKVAKIMANSNKNEQKSQEDYVFFFNIKLLFNGIKIFTP